MDFQKKPSGFFALLCATFFSSYGYAQEVSVITDSVDAGDITVTGTREAVTKGETAASVGTLGAEEFDAVNPARAADIVGRIPGGHVNQMGAEGYKPAIRQPITAKPVYLYLEDGVPVNSTGFFSHRTLSEMNLPQAGGMEVLKGPGTALYGSDAIGGIFNVLTRPAPPQAMTDISLEAGEYGWRKMLLSSGNSWDSDGIRGDLNITRTDGWRNNGGYERESATLRWDHFLDSGASLKTVLTGTETDEESAGSSITKADCDTDPTINYTPIAFSKKSNVRLSVAYEKEDADSLLSLTPYLRDSSTESLPDGNLKNNDPLISDISNSSIGMQLKYRKDFSAKRTRLIVGADIDHSPGSHHEDQIAVTKVGNTYESYTLNGVTLYDYDVTFQGISPYVHVETSPSEKLRLSAGLRYDDLSYDYDNLMSDATITQGTGPATKNWYHPSDTTVDFSHVSPKLGATYAFENNLSGFVSLKHAFRVPSEGQLFRSGPVADSTSLEAVKSDSFELGLRGKGAANFDYELSYYYMVNKDDILTYKDGNQRFTVNAGETLHRGIELGLGKQLAERLRLDVAYAYSRHNAVEWAPATNVDYSGLELKQAPRSLANIRLNYRPVHMKGGRVELEWVHVGAYWMDDLNTTNYGGHDLLNLRANYPINRQTEVYARVTNLTYRQYAEVATLDSKLGETFAPGMPRTYYVGMKYRF